MGSFLYWSHLRVFCTRIRLSQSDNKKVCNMTAGGVVWGLMIKKHPAPFGVGRRASGPFSGSLCALRACSVASVVSNSWWYYGLSSVSLLCPRGSPGKNTGAGCHAFLQEIFPTQGSNSRLLHLLHWQGGSLPPAPPGKSWVSLWSEGELDSTRKRWSLKSSPASSEDRRPSSAKEAYSLYSILA